MKQPRKLLTTDQAADKLLTIYSYQEIFSRMELIKYLADHIPTTSTINLKRIFYSALIKAAAVK